MKYAFLVAWREYVENAKAKGFWIGIFMLPLLLFLSIQVPIWLEEKATPVRYFVLVDQSGQFAPVIETALDRSYRKQVQDALREYVRRNAKPGVGALPEIDGNDATAWSALSGPGGPEAYLQQAHSKLREDAPPFRAPRLLFVPAKAPPELDTQGDLNLVAAALKPYLRGEKTLNVNGQPVGLQVAILIPRNIEEQIVRAHAPLERLQTQAKGVQYWSTDATGARAGFGLSHEVEQAINAEIRRREYLARGIDGAAIREVEATYVPFSGLNPKKEAGQEAVNQGDVIRQWAPSAFVYLLWLAIFVIIQMLLNNTLEEKSNRIIEVLLSSVTPGELMMGKLFGIAATGLTMVGAWILALFSILSWKAGSASMLAGALLLVLKSSNLVPLFAVYFLLGYLMYAAFILSIGSVCNSIKEAQSYMGILTMVMMVPLMTMTFIPKDPNGPVARVLSWIPLYTPFTMMNRATADPPLLDIVGTLLLLLVTTAVALWMAGKIFRIGILRTGQPPKIVEMLRWATRKES